MKTFKHYLVVVIILFPFSVFSQKSDKNIISYTYVKDDKGKTAMNRFNMSTHDNFVGSDEKNIYLSSDNYITDLYSSSLASRGAKQFLYKFDKKTMTMGNPFEVDPDKSLKGFIVKDIFTFKNKIFVMMVNNNTNKLQTSYYIQEFDGETLHFKGTPLKLYDEPSKFKYSELGFSNKDAYLITFPPFTECRKVINKDYDKMLFLFMPLKRRDDPQKIYSFLLDENLSIAKSNEYEIKNTAGKDVVFHAAVMNNNGRAFITCDYTTDDRSETYKKSNYKFLVLDLLSQGDFKEGNIANKDFYLDPLKLFIVDDTLAYNVSTTSTIMKKSNSNETKEERGLYMGMYSLNSGDVIEEKTISLEKSDFNDLKGDLKSAEKTGEIGIVLYFTYNKFTRRMYIVYEAVSNEQIQSGGNLKIKEFDGEFMQTGTFTFKREKGEDGVVPVSAPGGTYFLTNSSVKNENYENEANFKVDKNWPGYYVLKIKDSQLSAYGYSIKQPFDNLRNDLSTGFLDIMDDEKMFYLYFGGGIGGRFSFVNIKFQ